MAYITYTFKQKCSHNWHCR